MTQFPINRRCPLTNEPYSKIIGYVPAALIGRSNPTYRSDYLGILGLEPEDEFPLAMGPSGFVFAGWMPDGDFLRRVYEEAIDHSRTVTESVWYRQLLLEFGAAFLRLVGQGTSRKTPIRLLDYGCGYGALLRMLGSRDIQVFGYEPSAKRGSRASEANLQILSDLDSAAEAGPFDLFVCTEVLEHMGEPREALRFIRANAAPGALLALTVPNCGLDYVKSSIFGIAAGRELSPVVNPWEHLNYFSHETIRSLLGQEGFTVMGDFGRSHGARNACWGFSEVPSQNIALNSLRIAKRAWVATPTTQLFCRCA